MRQRYLLILGYVWTLLTLSLLSQTSGQLRDSLSELDIDVVEVRSTVEGMLAKTVAERIRESNRKSTAEWMSIPSREEWEKYRAQKISRLRDSLGTFAVSSGPPNTQITGEVFGEGYRIENLIFESRPGLWVTANLYVPVPERDSMPGILICHSHHNPKTQGELQDMGMTWARWGCLTLIMDQLGHGERRDHPFSSEEDYAGDFQVGRQDYYFRYNLGIQLHLIGESLVGWMVWDLMRGLDLLVAREGIDPERLILLGAVAGGGDPAAIAAVLDDRIAAAVPLNFGGPQGYHPYPLPEDSEESFNYAGSGSWESTRNLRVSCRDGFLPWVIVGGIAPRRLVYAHEFSWDRERDPVWKRLVRLYHEIYDVPDRLEYSHGYGVVRKRPPEASHCNNIGPVQRERIHQAFRRWFGIEGSQEKEYSQRLDPEELLCMTPAWKRKLKPLPLYEKAEALARSRLEQVKRDLDRLTAEARVSRLQQLWRAVLGEIDPAERTTVVSEVKGTEQGIEIIRLLLKEEESDRREILLPVVMLRSINSVTPGPVVVCVAQGGKSEFLRRRAEGIASLISEGLAVCLLDVRGTGETASGEGRGRLSQDTETSSSVLMLGETLVGERLRDLRTVLSLLRSRPEIARDRIVIWGDSLEVPNPMDRDFRVPMGLDWEPSLSEPLGGLLSLLALLFEPDLRGAYAHGGLVSFQSVLSSPFCYLPHDVVIPGVIAVGDIPVLVSVLEERKVRLAGLVDGLNLEVSAEDLAQVYGTGVNAHRTAEYAERTAWILQSVR